MFKSKKATQETTFTPVDVGMDVSTEIEPTPTEKKEPAKPIIEPTPAPAPAPLTPEQVAVAGFDTEFTTTISRKSTITGELKSDANIEIFGTVVGPVYCATATKVFGKVEGNIQSDALVANGANITGNITCKNALVIGNNCTILGDVEGKDITISGKVTGQIKASNCLTLMPSAVIMGDMSTNLLEIHMGAALQGVVKTERVVNQNEKKDYLENSRAKSVEQPKFEEKQEEKETVAASSAE